MNKSANASNRGLSPEAKTLKAYEYLRTNLPHGQPGLKDLGKMEMPLSAYVQASKIILGLTHELKVPITLIGNYAVRLHGYEERAVKSLEFLTTEERIEKIAGAVSLQNPQSPEALFVREGNWRAFYHRTPCGGINRDIPVDFVSLTQLKGMVGREEEILKRGVFVMDHYGAPVTRCAIVSDLVQIKLNDAKEKGRNGKEDVEDLQWLAQHKSKDLSSEQLKAINGL